MLDRLLARSTRTGPIFDLLRLGLVESEADLVGVPGPRLPGLPRSRSRPLGTCRASIVSPLLEEVSDVGEPARFMFLSPRGGARHGEVILSSSSVRLLKIVPLDRDFKNAGSNRLGRARLAPVLLVLAKPGVGADNSFGAEMKL